MMKLSDKYKSKSEKMIDSYFKTLTKNSPFIAGSLSEEIKYIMHNKKRYISALSEIDILAENINKEICILDIGTSPFTFILRERFKNAKIYSVDYTDKFKKQCKLKNIHFKKVDLNKQEIEFGKIKFDVVIFLEVIEHLQVDSKQALSKITGLIVANGYCILQTPNKYSLKAQAEKVVSRVTFNKLCLLSPIPVEFVHNKEYSLGELSSILQSIKNLVIIKKEYTLYFDDIDSALVYRKHSKMFQPLIAANFFIVKNAPFLRRGMQFIFQKIVDKY